MTPVAVHPLTGPPASISRTNAALAGANSGGEIPAAA